MQNLMAVRHHVRAIYLNDVDRVERGVALGMAFTFIHQHMDEFDIGQIAVRGSQGSIISECLLQAVHSLVCSAALNLRPPTAPSEVRHLAESLSRETST